MDALATNTTLAALDVSWNALRVDSARMLSEALLSNGGIQHLDLSHNGFSDADAARIIKALGEHGAGVGVDVGVGVGVSVSADVGLGVGVVAGVGVGVDADADASVSVGMVLGECEYVCVCV